MTTWISVAITLAVIASVSLWIFSYIDDWSRDLTQNAATTHDTEGRPWMSALTLSETPEKVAQTLQTIGNDKPIWSVETVETQDTGETQVHLIRKTALLGFIDDIHANLVPVDTGTRVDVSSQSRIGKGDLGQNPRNIEDLNRWLADQFKN
jgi:uncharacterized protein (DUF1499 family)